MMMESLRRYKMKPIGLPVERTDGLRESRFRILNDDGKPTEMVQYYLFEDYSRPALIGELQYKDERFGNLDPACDAEMCAWIGERIGSAAVVIEPFHF